MSFAQLGFILGSWQMTYIVLAIAAGVIMDRWGIRRSIFCGSLVIGLSAGLGHRSAGFAGRVFHILGGDPAMAGDSRTAAFWYFRPLPHATSGAEPDGQP